MGHVDSDQILLIQFNHESSLNHSLYIVPFSFFPTNIYQIKLTSTCNQNTKSQWKKHNTNQIPKQSLKLTEPNRHPNIQHNYDLNTEHTNKEPAKQELGASEIHKTKEYNHAKNYSYILIDHPCNKTWINYYRRVEIMGNMGSLVRVDHSHKQIKSRRIFRKKVKSMWLC